MTMFNNNNNTLLNILASVASDFNLFLNNNNNSNNNLSHLNFNSQDISIKNQTNIGNYECNFTIISSFGYDEKICLKNAPNLTKSTIIRVYVLSAMAGISLLGNIATILNIRNNRAAKRLARQNWSAIYCLMLHLSIADLLVTGFCIIGEAAWSYTVEWIAGEISCKLVKFFQMFSLYLSTYVLVLIGIDRWIAVKYPMKSLNMERRCNRLLIVAYTLSFVLSLPQCLVFQIVKGPFYEDFYQCVTYGFYSALWQEQLYTTFSLLFMFLIPLIILIITYISTFKTISDSEKMFQQTTECIGLNRQRLIHKAKSTSLRISIIIVFAFIVCWTPYYVMMLIFMFLNPDTRLSEDLQSGIFFFGMSNSLINPVIYGAFHLRPLKKPKRNNIHISFPKSQSSK